MKDALLTLLAARCKDISPEDYDSTQLDAMFTVFYPQESVNQEVLE